MPLLRNELERYSRQILLPEFGVAGQERLQVARVLIIGAGGLGSPAALYLAAMGVGTIGIVDDDAVAVSNLHRQILYRETDTGKPKSILAAERLLEMNSKLNVRAIGERLTRDNAIEILRGFDLVLDGSDNFSTRYLVNDACLVLGIPLVSASILRFEGQLAVLCSDDGPCYRCLFPDPPNADEAPSCAEAGVIGALAGIMGTMMAMEAVKIIANIGKPLTGRLLLYDALSAHVREMKVQRDPSCASCSVPFSERRLFVSYDFGDCADDADEISWEALLRTRLPLVDVREAWEYAAEPSNGILIPLDSLLDRIKEMPGDEFAVVCASGIRSRKAVQMLREHGHAAKSVRGGLRSLK